MNIRVRFGKEGGLRFIGHLDVLRSFQKIFRRAGLPMAYSQGFSPHPIMSFALPLGLGLSSEGEYLDAELREELPVEQILTALQAATTPELPVYRVLRLPDKAENAMASVGRAIYRASFDAALSAEALERGLQAVLAKTSLVILKKTKTKETDCDIRPAIHALRREGQALVLELGAGSVDNLKPETVLALICAEAGLEYVPGSFSLRRLDLLDRRGRSLGEAEEQA